MRMGDLSASLVQARMLTCAHLLWLRLWMWLLCVAGRCSVADGAVLQANFGAMPYKYSIPDGFSQIILSQDLI